MDLFFVISGFVMVWASWDAWGRAASVAPFVWRRVLRVVPLYWLLTAATVAVALVLPGSLSDGLRDGWGYVAASFGFWPWRRADGFVQPVLRLGWTLEYEAMFYALVAASLLLPRRVGIAVLLGALAALAWAGQVVAFAAVPLAFWTDPIVMEFALGIVAACLARRGVRAGWVTLGLAALCLVLDAAWPDAPRVIARGLPAAFLLFSALSWTRVPAWLLLLGDASYALYLVHPFPMRAVRMAVARLPGASVPLYLAVALVACVALAVLLFLCVERPILRLGRRWADAHATNAK